MIQALLMWWLESLTLTLSLQSIRACRRTDGQSLQEEREQMFIRKVSSKITVINYFKNNNTQRALSLTESPAAVIVSEKQTHRWQKCYFFDLPTEV